MGRVRKDENYRESWFATNLTNKILSIGDLPQVPTFKPGQQHDLLRFCSRSKISHSQNLVQLVNMGWLRLVKKKINDVSENVSSVVEDAITPAEENEIGAVGSTTLDGLTDVDTTGVADGEVLTFDSGTGTWVPSAAGSGTLTQAEKDNLELELKLDLTDVTRFIENTYTGNQLTAIDVWEDNTMTVKLFNIVLSYSGNQLTSQVITRISDAATLTKTYSYTGNRLDSIDIT